MILKGLILLCFAFGLTSKYIVEGLQCYVCEDCNEYEDFKELHICGEIGTTIKPMTLPEVLGNNETATTVKSPAGETEEYIDIYSEETHDDNSSSSGNKKEESGSSSQSNSSQSNAEEKNKETIETRTGTTTQSPTTTIQQEETNPTSAPEPTTLNQTETQSNSSSDVSSNSNASLSISNITTANTSETTLNNSKPLQLPDDDDYMEYDIPSEDRRQVNIKAKSLKSSLLKINEPVCYMIKYHVNNTVITNRGCTTFINANKQLTCQSLYNGAPMEKCLICSNDGCNKFLSDYSYEDDTGLPISAGGVLERFGIFVIVMLALANFIVA